MTSWPEAATAAAILLVLASVPAAASEEGGPMPAFPEVDGFSKDGEPLRFDSFDLFEYVNGDAFSYQGFGFEELAVQEYRGEGDRGLTAEIFRHSSDDNGFGIYGYERPAEGRFLEIGGEAYHETGVLNFVKGRFYVKLKGVNLGEVDEPLLTRLAGSIAASIDGPAGLPRTASCFPEKNRVEHSVRYVASDFLGHGFLHSAFVAEYRFGDRTHRAFVVEAADESEARKMVGDYLALVERKGGRHEEKDGVVRFTDPYRTRDGTLNLARAGSRLVGLFHDDPAVAQAFLQEVTVNLP